MEKESRGVHISYPKRRKFDKVLKNGMIGNYEEIVYCNEKEYTGVGFLFKCGVGCKHNLLS